MSTDEIEQKHKERIARIADVIRKDLDPYHPQLLESYDRVSQLLVTAARLATLGPKPSEAAADVLRAAVVLTHAFLEDFLRTLTSRLLPHGTEDDLRDIPLAGTEKRRSQFHLGQLVQHREKTVDTVIRESVSEYLERSTFNSTSEIVHVLVLLHLKVKNIDNELSLLDEMIRRRHQIVHRSDKVQRTNSSAYTLEPIQSSQVQSWLRATYNFTVAVIASIAAASVMEVLKRDSGLAGPASA